jgi:hypothetical protein
LSLPPSSRALVRRVRSSSAATLTPASPRPSSRPTSAPDRSRKSHRRVPDEPLPAVQHVTGARLHLALPKLAPDSSPIPSLPSASSLDRLLRPLARTSQVALPLGPCDAYQPALTWPSVRPCERSPTGRAYLSRLFPCRGSADRVSDRIVHGHPPFRGFSPPGAAGPSRAPPSSLPFPTSRCRGSEDFSVALQRRLAASMSRAEHHAHLAVPPLLARADAFSAGGVVHAVVGSLLSWLFPPFEDGLPASPRTSAGLLSWASIVRGSLRLTLRLIDAGSHVRSSECQRTGSLIGVTRPPSVGSLSPQPTP